MREPLPHPALTPLGEGETLPALRLNHGSLPLEDAQIMLRSQRLFLLPAGEGQDEGERFYRRQTKRVTPKNSLPSQNYGLGTAVGFAFSSSSLNTLSEHSGHMPWEVWVENLVLK